MNVQLRGIHRTRSAARNAGGSWCTLGLLLMGIAAAPTALSQAPSSAQRCSREEYDINADCVVEGPRPQIVAREVAPIELAGYWLGIVSEEWRWRMMTPPKGDRASIPLNLKAQEAMNDWDPAKPDQCKAFGAPAGIRNPVRIRFTWVDDNHLRLETDHGQVTRDFYFGDAKRERGEPSMQGDSVASWEGGALKVVTTNLKPGFLRKNGIPYSDQTVLTEYFDRYSAAGANYLTVTAVVKDPVYLTRDFVVTTDFRSLPDGAAWRPVSCDQPLVIAPSAKR